MLGAILFGLPFSPCGFAGGVTVITHGYNGNVNGWVTGMADQMTNYPVLPGTNSTTYKLTLTKPGSSFLIQATRANGVAPSVSDSGEIIVKLDWGSVAGGLFPESTYDVAFAVSLALQQTNLIAELNGHALTEYPLHLIGHSRGGSLVSEMSRDLGTNGVWVDHMTTLDPHPLNNDGFSDPVFATDASVKTYVNILFHDDYWENINSYPIGEAVAGAYVRQLTALPGGYTGTAGDHSDVHLWYHATIDQRAVANDGEATLSVANRPNWFVSYEKNGTNAGFLYSLIGGGNRLSEDQPVGQGFPSIKNGYNQNWDLGAGTSANRIALPLNSGGWPNLLKFNRATTNQVEQGQAMPVTFYYQWAKAATNLATISIYLDDDFNPINTNQTLLRQIVVPANGASFVSFATTNLTLFASNAQPGIHTVLAQISGGGKTRYLYAPEKVKIVAPSQPPVLDIVRLGNGQVRVGVTANTGQTIILQTSADFFQWSPLATNTLTGNQWLYLDTAPASVPQRYYRAVSP